MGRKTVNKNAGGGGFAAHPLCRSLFFWLAPVSFMLSTLGSQVGSAGGGDGDNAALALPLAGELLVLSGIFLALDCWLQTRGNLVFVQLLVQLLVVASGTGLFSSAPPAPGSAPSAPSADLAPPAPPADSVDASLYAGGGLAEVPSMPAEEGLRPRPSGQRSLLSKGSPSRGGSAAAAAPEVEGDNKISIVLPCLNETEVVIKTVNRFCERTPQDRLQEIIVVDDGSTPPLEGLLRRGGIDDKCKLRVLRHDKPYGLMIAKQTGGDAAEGRYIGFYDCHVSPAPDWHVETLKLLSEKERRLVVPLIGDLDLDTFDHKKNSAGTAKCYINFNADFWWYDDESDNIPIISGGLVATTRAWWRDSGGFDKGMRGWGGENTDQSLRAWLCGGDVVRAKSSRIAHMWRVPNDQRTLAKFKPPGGVDNLGRVAAMWFDEFKAKFRDGHATDNLDVSDGIEMRERLQCKPFAHFLHRFRKIYINGGIIPEEVFKIRHVGTTSCIMRSGGGYDIKPCTQGTWFHMANMRNAEYPTSDEIFSGEEDDSFGSGQVVCGGHSAASCSKCPQGNGEGWCHVDCAWSFGACVRKERVQAMRKSRNKKACCSGIREWNSLYCFDALQGGGPMPYQCDLAGGNRNQQYLWETSGKIRHMTGLCIGVKGFRTNNVDCEKGARFEKFETFVPEEWRLYKEAVERLGLTDDMPDH